MKEMESRVMPRNSMEVPGPDVFSLEKRDAEFRESVRECIEPVARR